PSALAGARTPTLDSMAVLTPVPRPQGRAARLRIRACVAFLMGACAVFGLLDGPWRGASAAPSMPLLRAPSGGQAPRAPAPGSRSAARAWERASAAPTGTPMDLACGTHLESAPQAYEAFAEHAASSATGPQPTPHSTDAGEIAVLEDDGTFFFTDKNGNAN